MYGRPATHSGHSICVRTSKLRARLGVLTQQDDLLIYRYEHIDIIAAGELAADYGQDSGFQTGNFLETVAMD